MEFGMDAAVNVAEDGVSACVDGVMPDIERNDSPTMEGEGIDVSDVYHFTPKVASELTPRIGQEFSTEEDAYNFYNGYAKLSGFSIRKGSTRRLANGDLASRELLCSKAGLRRSTVDAKRRKYKERSLTRCNCPALIVVNKGVGSEQWVVGKFVEDHNHTCETPVKSHCLRSHRYVPTSHIDIAEGLHKVGVGVARTLEYMALETGGLESVGFSQADLRNALRKRRQERYSGGALDLMAYFQKKTTVDPNFSFDIQHDDENHLTSCFWVDGDSKLDYAAFNDVVCFDTTYKTNEFEMPFGPFVGVNHHKQSVLLGAGLLFGETKEDFKWLFNAWLTAMGGVPPKAIVTDQDAAILAAVAEVFPETHHVICLWHLNKKFHEKLATVIHQFPSFKSRFSSCIYNSDGIEEFESAWSNVMSEFKLEENRWLQGLHRIRQMWVSAYVRHIFLAGMTTTGRSESMNSLFDKFVNRKTKLLEFAEAYEQAAKRRRHDELQADCGTTHGTPALATSHTIESDMSKIYSKEIFSEFQKEVVATQYYVAVLREKDGSVDRYEVFKYENIAEDKIRRISWDNEKNIAFCMCLKFEFCGFVCRHVLAVFRLRGIVHMPESHILKRWTKRPKEKIIVCGTQAISSVENSGLARWHKLIKKWSEVAGKATANYKLFQVAEVGLENILMEMEQMEQEERDRTDPSNEDIVQGSDADRHEHNTLSMDIADPKMGISLPTALRDPHRTKTKGRTAARYKSTLEVEMKKRSGRLCRGCKTVVVGHDKRNCPMLQDNAENSNREGRI